MATVELLMGNHALSYGVKLARVKVIAAYPITPQTEVVELLADMCATGELDATFIKVESEHSALAAVVGASAAGVRAFTATSAQGLAYMHEVIHWAVGARLPIVLGNINRAMAPPWSIWTEQNDSLAQRDTGIMQFYAESNQEVLDTVIQAYKVSEKVLLPSMIVLAAFVLSHTSEPVEIPDQELVDKFLPPYQPRYYLDPDNPAAFGGLTGPDWYFELRYQIQKAMEDAKHVIREVDDEFYQYFGRRYGLIEEYKTEGTDIRVVTAGDVTGTTRVIVDELQKKGYPVGLVKIRVFRPFPAEDVVNALKGAKKVLVLDRNISFGQSGIFFQEVKSALYNRAEYIPMWGFVTGLGGRDVTPEMIEAAIRYVMEHDEPRDLLWLGVKKRDRKLIHEE